MCARWGWWPPPPPLPRLFGLTLRVTLTSPSAMMYMHIVPPAPRPTVSPCRITYSPSWKVTSVSMSCNRCSWATERDSKALTERSVRSKSTAGDFIRTDRKALRPVAHSTPSVAAVTVAARGFEYMSASSPNEGYVPLAVVYRSTSTCLPPCRIVTAYSPCSTT